MSGIRTHHNLVVIGNDYIGSCRPTYYTITTTTAPEELVNWYDDTHKHWKESWNDNGQKLHSYQQNEQLTLYSFNIKIPRHTCEAGNPDPGLGRAEKCGGE